jgi:glucokinase
MLPFREVKYVDEIPRNSTCIMVGDIGGTNSNFGFFRFSDHTFKLLLSIHVKSALITDFSLLVADLVAYVKKNYQITVTQSGFAAAGIVSKTLDHTKPTNLNFVIDAQEILAKTKLKCAFVVNDFAVIGYGLDFINPKDLVLVNRGNAVPHANMAILGAGTGLGKSIMHWNRYVGRYVPIDSEGGHADFAAQNELELDLCAYIKKTEGFSCSISWEDVLSGFGIERIYRFFHTRNQQVQSATSIGEKGPKPDEIFNSRTQDIHAWHTFELYTKIYARCAKNFALDALALGGVYIAGGIAAKNLPMFELDIFMQEFVNCGKQQKILKNIPVYVITDYNISLYGAARYMQLEAMCG